MKNIIILDSERRNFPSSNKLLTRLYKYSEDAYLKIVYNIFIIPKLKKCLKENNTRIIAADKETELVLKKNNLPFHVFNDYIGESDYLSYEKEVLNYSRNLPKLLPGINQSYGGLSLWRADESDIYLSFFKPILTKMEIIKKIITFEKAKKITVLDSSSRLGMVQMQFKESVEVSDRTSILSIFKKKMMYLFAPLFLNTIRSEFIKIIKSADYHPTKTKEILFFERERPFIYAHPFLKEFKDKTTILQDEEYSKKLIGHTYDSIGNYISANSKERLIVFRNLLKNHLKLVLTSQAFRSSFIYKNINIYDLFTDLIRYLFINGYLKSAFYYECFNNLFTYSKPKLIITMCEVPKAQKIIIYASKKYKIKSLLVMHGVIGKRDLYDNLRSDYTAVYGNYYKKVIMYLNNKATRIIVTGNPFWDNIPKIGLNRKSLSAKLNLPNKKFILLATIHFPLDQRDALAYAVIKAMKNLPEYHLIIKLHPEEKASFYKKTLRKLHVNATIVGDISLLHPLIKYSELVIINDSTVGLETILFDKPLIDVNFTVMPYWNDYVEKGVALEVRKEENLLPSIISILENNKVINQLRINRKKYVHEHAYKQDGKATSRVIHFIKKLVRVNP